MWRRKPVERPSGQGAGNPEGTREVAFVARLRGVVQGVVHLPGEAPLPGGFSVQPRRPAEITAPGTQARSGISGREFRDAVPQYRRDPEFGLADHRLRINGRVGGALVVLGGIQPGQDIQEVEVSVDEHIAARAEQWSDDLPADWEQLGRPFPRWLLDAALEVCQTRGAVGRRS
ncbi:MAG: streptomycin 6-kinase, partial [Arthrobacter sp.]|nr:streptomycin 6-kinase [Arthrobacter sp.]